MKLLLAIIFELALFSSYSQSVAPPENINYDSVRIALEKMMDEDQRIRRILFDSIGLDSPDAERFKIKMSQLDRNNKVYIQKLLSTYGWLEKSKIGTKAADAIFLLVQHTDREFMIRYYPEFKKLADRDEASPRQCAMMEDRLLMWDGKKQIYGTQTNDWFRADKKMAIWPIEDVATVNERRKKVGFKDTVEEYAKKLNAIYDPDDSLPPK